MSPRILAAVDDLFFAAKILETAEKLGVPVTIARSAQDMVSRLFAGPDRPALLIFDLNSQACKPLETIAELKKDPDLRRIPTLGFLSHVQAELKQQAARAGCDTILPRSAFSERLPDLLRKYAPPSG